MHIDTESDSTLVCPSICVEPGVYRGGFPETPFENGFGKTRNHWILEWNSVLINFIAWVQ